MSVVQRLVPLEALETEILVVNSRFIGSLSPVNSVEEARTFINEIRKRFPDATHHVPAFLIGHGNSTITHCSDDGEPSGTAGRPALAVLQGSGLGNVCVVITRYFGGTKLGTGGLVKAYGDTVREVLKGVKKAVLLPTTTLMFVTPYPLYEQAVRLIEAHQGQILDREFAVDVSVSARLKDEEVENFLMQLSNLSAGQIEPIVVEQNPETVFPLS